MGKHRRLHRQERQHKNKVIVMSLFGLVLLFSCGYAAFKTQINLKVKGTITEKEEIILPTFTEIGDTEKTITITYPEGCGSNYTCTYQKDSEDVVTVLNTTATLTFTTDGIVVATVTKGSKTVSSSYMVEIYYTAYIVTEYCSGGCSESYSVANTALEAADNTGSNFESMIATNPEELVQILEQLGVSYENASVVGQAYIGKVIADTGNVVGGNVTFSINLGYDNSITLSNGNVIYNIESLTYELLAESIIMISRYDESSNQWVNVPFELATTSSSDKVLFIENQPTGVYRFITSS